MLHSRSHEACLRPVREASAGMIYKNEKLDTLVQCPEIVYNQDSGN
jgi:hypothetical protein